MKTKGWSIIAGTAALCVILAVVQEGVSQTRKHNFAGQCALCHLTTPEEGILTPESALREDVNKKCVMCHRMDSDTSHPVGVTPSSTIPLERYLDQERRLTCTTCHDVHKEEKQDISERELKGLLRGHNVGRAFCLTCHSEDRLGADWRHTNVIASAHLQGRLIQDERGGMLDSFSIECLSCHDGVIASMGETTVRAGSFTHGIGLSHPIGNEYPRFNGKNDFVNVEFLPRSIKLVDGKVGCLSCHNPYGSEDKYLVVQNKRSALCLTCHQK